MDELLFHRRDHSSSVKQLTHFLVVEERDLRTKKKREREKCFVIILSALDLLYVLILEALFSPELFTLYRDCDALRFVSKGSKGKGEKLQGGSL